ncbi:MAG TPA: RecX family transcriptional regulator [Candidatus Omnitrophica bacterium]|nr:RecX family transcriptional regulator [Candidatus Omnitrophota bacterium]
MQDRDDLSKARNCALRLIKFRLRSEKEVRDKLKEKGFAAETIDTAVDFLKKTGLLDDTLFARLWVESRIKRPLGLARLRLELKKKGIDKGVIEPVLEAASANYSEEEAVKNIIDMKIKKMRGLDPVKAKRRLYGFLLRRGYPYGLVMDALKEIEE